MLELLKTRSREKLLKVDTGKKTHLLWKNKDKRITDFISETK